MTRPRRVKRFNNAMKTFVRLAVFISLSCLGVGAQAQPSHHQDLYGTWQIVGYSFGDGVSVGTSEAKKLIGTRIRFEAERAVSKGDVCAQPAYGSRRIDAGEFFREFRTSLKSIGIKNKDIAVLDVKCSGETWNAPGSLLLILNEGRVLTPWDGVFFVMKKVSKRR